MSGQKSKLGSPVAIVVGVLVSAGFVVLAARWLDWSGVWAALGAARLWPWVPLAVGSYVVGHLVRGVRLRLILRGQAELQPVTAANIVVVGYAVNNILPARMGELARSAILSERTGLPFAQSLTTTLLERILDGLAILALFALTSRVLPVTGWLHTSVVAATWIFSGAFLAIIAAAIAPHLVWRLTSGTTWMGPKLHHAVLRLVLAASNAIAFLRRPRQGLSVFALSLVVWCCEAGMFLAVLPAFGLPLKPAWALAAMTITNLGILVPSSPGFIGPFHYFCMSAIAAAGVPNDTAFSYAVLVHAAFYLPVTLWGIGALARYGVEMGTLLSIARRAEKLKPEETDAHPLHSVSRVRPAPPVERPPSKLMTAIVEAACPFDSVPLDEAARAAVLTRVATFVCGQIDALPESIGVLFTVGVTGFRTIVGATHLRGFCKLAPASRRRIFEAWAYGRIGLTRKLFRVVRSTALLAFYDDPVVTAALVGQAPRAEGTAELVRWPTRASKSS